ncbi:MAG: ABC transporter permease [Bifidobacteriaceae bacterium]|jgi:ABC-2 type transport system permease protein|nr:ABC transporter permease [Bifidobacteriaceae bacterium]
MKLVHLVPDMVALTGRMLRHNIRSPDTIMTVLGMPVMILLAFVFVLGGAMRTSGTRYVDYVVPAVVLMCVASGAGYTAFRVNLDVSSGIFARLHTMPIARSAILGGHAVASVAANAVSVAVILLVSLLIGYRPRANLAGWLLSAALVGLALVMFASMGLAFGLMSRGVEGSSMFSYLVIGLLFVSSGFAPTSTMPTPLRAFADYQPMTPVINAIRDAQLGAPRTADTWTALAWLTGLAVAFGVLAHLTAPRRIRARL